MGVGLGGSWRGGGDFFLFKLGYMVLLAGFVIFGRNKSTRNVSLCRVLLGGKTKRVREEWQEKQNYGQLCFRWVQMAQQAMLRVPARPTGYLQTLITVGKTDFLSRFTSLSMGRAHARMTLTSQTRSKCDGGAP